MSVERVDCPSSGGNGGGGGGGIACVERWGCSDWNQCESFASNNAKTLASDLRFLIR